MCSVFAWLGFDPPMFNPSKLKDKGWQKSRNHTTLNNTLQNHNSIFELVIKIYEKRIEKVTHLHVYLQNGKQIKKRPKLSFFSFSVSTNFTSSSQYAF